MGRPRRRGGPRTRVLALLVVVLLVTSGMLWSLDRLTGGLEEREEGDGDRYNVTGELTWTGVAGPLEHPITVHAGGNLRLVGCDLRVLMEDLLIWHRPPIVVHDGARLVMEDTDVRLHWDPHLDEAVYWSNWEQNSIPHWQEPPYLSRLMDLEGTEDPVLSLAVSWRGEPTDLLVAAQTDTSEEPVMLDVLRPPSAPYGEWLPYEVDLGPVAGTICQVVLFPFALQTRAFLVSDLEVTDGGEPPPWDVFGPGDPYENGWGTSRDWSMPGVRDAFRTRDTWPGLLDAWGEVVLRGSTLSAPGDLPRWLEEDPWDRWEPWTPGWEVEPPPLEADWPSNHFWATKGGELSVAGDALTITGSRLENVPLLALGSELDIQASAFEGDVDLVTLDGCSGGITDSELAYEEGDEGWEDRYAYSRYKDYPWGLSAVGTSQGTLSLSGCTFRGCDVALELNATEALVTDCAFEDTGRVAVWAHEMEGWPSWDRLNATNAFADCRGAWYLRTSMCEFRTNVTERSSGDWGYPDIEILEPPERLLPDLDLVHMGQYFGDVFLPVDLVDVNGTRHHYPHVDLRFTDWGDYEKEVSVDTNVEYEEVWLEPIEIPEYDHHRYDFLGTVLDPGPVAGVVSVTFHVFYDALDTYGFRDNLSFQVELDGETLEEHEVPNITRPLESARYSNETNVSIPAGEHEVRLSLWARHENGSSPEELVNRTLPFLRVTPGSIAGDVSTFVTDVMGYLVVDPGVDLDVDLGEGFGFWYEDWYDTVFLMYLDLFTFEGSRIRFHDIQTPADPWFVLDCVGDGRVEIADSYIDYIHLAVDGGTIQFDSTTFAHGMDQWSSQDHTLGIDDCSFAWDHGYHHSLNLRNMSIHIANTTFMAREPGEIELRPFDNATVTVRDCRFSNTSLSVRSSSHNPYNATLDVRGCLFEGAAAFVKLQLREHVNYPDGPGSFRGRIEANRFVGNGTGIVGRPDLLRELVGSNDMDNGARILAQYGVHIVTDVEDNPHDYHYSWSFADGGWDVYRYLDVDRYSDDRRFAYLDVTGDLLSADHPDEVSVVFYSGHGQSGRVVWFDRVDVTRTSVTVHVPPVPEPDDIVRWVRAHISELVSWWEG